MANELVLNKILIIKGILAEKCGLHPDLYEELSDLLDDIRILNDAKDSALAELSHESSGLNKPVVNHPVCHLCRDTGWYFIPNFAGGGQTVRCGCGK